MGLMFGDIDCIGIELDEGTWFYGLWSIKPLT